MTHHEIPTFTQDALSIAYEARVRFLNPGGIEESKILPIDEPTLDHAKSRLTVPELGEVVAIGFGAVPVVSLEYDGEIHTRRFKGGAVGNMYLATMWDQMEYSFESLESILDKDELPIYTAEWLARWVRANKINYRDDPLYAALSRKRPFADEGELMPEPRAAKVARIMQKLLHEYPHLAARFVARGMISEGDLPQPLEHAAALESATFRLVLDDLSKPLKYTGHGGLRKPAKQVDTNTGVSRHVTAWAINGIEDLRCDDTGVTVSVVPGADISVVKSELTTWLEQYAARQKSSENTIQTRPSWHDEQMKAKAAIRPAVNHTVKDRGTGRQAARIETGHATDYQPEPEHEPTLTCARPAGQKTDSAHRIVFTGLTERDLARLSDMEQPVSGVVDERGEPVRLTAWSPSDIKKTTGGIERFWGISGIQSRDTTTLGANEAAYYIDRAEDEAHIRDAIMRMLRTE